MMSGMAQVKYGWSPKASLGPQMARTTERTQAEALRDSAELMDYQSAYGQEAWQHLSASMVLTVQLPASVPSLFCAASHGRLQPHTSLWNLSVQGYRHQPAAPVMPCLPLRF